MADGTAADDGVPTGVGRTALGTALVRAMESARPNRLFHDPYAAAFLAAAPAVFRRGRSADRVATTAATAHGRLSPADSPIPPAVSFWSHVVIRTRFFDDYLLDATARGVRQVVLLAAGLDTRAYRLPWPPEVRVFEVDLPAVLDFKQRVLDRQTARPQCERHVVPADLREDWPASLLAAGLRAQQPTAWLPEGLLMYLTAAQATNLLAAIGELSVEGSRLAIEHEQVDDMLAQARRIPAIAEYTALWHGGLPDTRDFLAADGWRIETHSPSEVNTRYARKSSAPTVGGFVSATKARAS